MNSHAQQNSEPSGFDAAHFMNRAVRQHVSPVFAEVRGGPVLSS